MSRALYPKTETSINDIAIADDSVIPNTIHGHMRIWDAAAKIVLS